MPRYLPVRERAFRAIEAKLREIKESNGYNTTIRSVERTRTMPQQHTTPPQLYLMPDNSRVYWRGTNHKFERIPTDIWIVTQAVHDEDTEFNYIVADIQRCLKCGNISDPTYPVADWGQIYVEEDFTQPLYSQAQNGLTIGVIRYIFEYWRSHDDPRLWDSQDRLVAG